MKNIFYLVLFFSLSSSTMDRSNLDLKIMTFNIRYDNPDDNKNNWKYRKEEVTKMIRSNGVDILGAQEVLANQLKDISEKLPDYNAIGVGREDGKEKGEFSPIFYKKDKFTVVKSGYFWLSETPEKPSKGWDAACERIATWAQLKDIKTNKMLFVVNTHFDHEGMIARQESVKLIKEKVALLSEGLPLIIMGDFNAEPESSVVKQMLSSAEAITIFDSRSRTSKMYGESWTFNGFGKVPVQQRLIIDYIFVNKDVKVKKHNILSETANGMFISDHSAVFIVVSI
ncbi:endonuclease/exonuclease/phosphatase family protein [Flavobacterium hiemivividum]|uniref:Endonuclease/exonuclease/phosphatase family protein n=1 Tax=Flavobacterium hiemivividum TaxID=2541734 RepID=A0A4R5D043_9FLAO|nr:endonuclease/exonuclease/phosphatase family protein [Flavobacterium hiemivividum]TDE03595.1 endonuclease/exonuclease/phosphatase family protein [Flavobacterium hiemivividum]